jgi:hypothetical protein
VRRYCVAALTGCVMGNSKIPSGRDANLRARRAQHPPRLEEHAELAYPDIGAKADNDARRTRQAPPRCGSAH